MQTNSLGDVSIFGYRVELRSVQQDDYELLFRWLNDPEVYRWWGGKPIDSDAIQQKYLGHRRPQVEGYVIEVTGLPIGYAQRHQTDDDEGSVDLFLVPEMRGRGYGIDAVRALVKYLTRVEGWKRITVDPEQDNLPAQSFWRKLGFVETEQITLEGNRVLILKEPPRQSSDGEFLPDKAAPRAPIQPMSAVIDRVLAALNARDLEAFVSCYTAEATIEDGNDRVLARGHSEIRNRYGSMFEVYPALNVEPLGRWKVGSFVVQEERVTGRAAESERHIAIYQLDNELIVRERLLLER